MEKNFAFSRMNYILLIVGLVVVIIGFALMAGPSTTEQAFEPDIFSNRRIVVGPMVCLFGFLFEVFAILWRAPRHKKEDTQPNSTLNTQHS